MLIFLAFYIAGVVVAYGLGCQAFDWAGEYMWGEIQTRESAVHDTVFLGVASFFSWLGAVAFLGVMLIHGIPLGWRLRVRASSRFSK